MYQKRPTSSPLGLSMSTDQHDNPRLMCKRCTCEYKKNKNKSMCLSRNNLQTIIYPFFQTIFAQRRQLAK